ncbi:MAG: MoaD/ThiS family protein [Methanimicrococcus sp.]|nr:MoaD/ThiS family protein [Methanimicrococcus sp.]
MKVSISVFGATNKSKDMTDMEIPEKTNAKDLILEFARGLPDPDLISDKEGNLKKHLIIQINKKRILPTKAADSILKEGDEVRVYPSVSGG